MNDEKNTSANRRFFLQGSVAVATAIAAGHPCKADEQPKTSFVEQQRISITADSARRIAIDAAGHAWLAAGKSVQQYNKQGDRLQRIDLDRSARCIAVYDHGILVGIRDHVQHFDFSGNHVRSYPSIGDGHLIGDVHVVGDVINAVDITANRLLHRSLDGDSPWSKVKSGVNGLSASSRVGKTHDQGWSVTDPLRHRVVRLNSTGNEETVWGHRSRAIDGFQGCCNPLAIVGLADGSCVTAEAGQVRIKRFDAQGKFLELIAGPDNIDALALVPEEDVNLRCGVGGIDLATGPDGSLWVLHAAAKELIRFAKIG